jgi:hypothetical protein
MEVAAEEAAATTGGGGDDALPEPALEVVVRSPEIQDALGGDYRSRHE